MHDELLEHGRMDTFFDSRACRQNRKKGPSILTQISISGPRRVGFQLQVADNPELRKTTDAMIRDIVAIQEPGGYLNTYYNGDRSRFVCSTTPRRPVTNCIASVTCYRAQLRTIDNRRSDAA